MKIIFFQFYRMKSTYGNNNNCSNNYECDNNHDLHHYYNDFHSENTDSIDINQNKN